MEKEFSEGFMHDIADILELCMKNNTDNVDLVFDINDVKFGVNITFSIDKPQSKIRI